MPRVVPPTRDITKPTGQKSGIYCVPMYLHICWKCWHLYSAMYTEMSNQLCCPLKFSLIRVLSKVSFITIGFAIAFPATIFFTIFTSDGRVFLTLTNLSNCLCFLLICTLTWLVVPLLLCNC